MEELSGPNGRTFKIENFAGIWHTGIPCIKISVAACLKARSNNFIHSLTNSFDLPWLVRMCIVNC